MWRTKAYTILRQLHVPKSLFICLRLSCAICHKKALTEKCIFVHNLIIHYKYVGINNQKLLYNKKRQKFVFVLATIIRSPVNNVLTWGIFKKKKEEKYIAFLSFSTYVDPWSNLCGLSCCIVVCTSSFAIKKAGLTLPTN